ncbi:MAG: nitroreductase family protein [Ruminiclostridium sp.]|nr:nitroreductase family protein [Ruminiclostridium sp.]
MSEIVNYKMMTVTQAIKDRRSIRKFKPDRIAKQQIELLISSACAAPSGKNRQPWEFIVVMDEIERDKVCNVMEQGIDQSEKERFVGTQPAIISSARNTLSIMRKAPATVFIFSPDIPHIGTPRTLLESLYDLAFVQSIGAAIQNMLLSAVEIGLGSLWICDVYFAYEELVKYFQQDGLMVAAVSLGVPDEMPGMRPRKPIEELVQWR